MKTTCGKDCLREKISYRHSSRRRIRRGYSPITRNADTFGYNDRSEVTSATIGGNYETHEYEGGWEFNGYYDTTTNYWLGGLLQTETYHLPPATADQLSDAQLQQIPFFLDFVNPEMHTSSNGTIVANNYLYRAEMLAYAIPAESYAVGANPMPGLLPMTTNSPPDNLYFNHDMAILFTSGQLDLPQNENEPKYMYRNWQHSTFVQRSYKRVHQLFKVINQHIKGIPQ
jgi:hypothetical protein